MRMLCFITLDFSFNLVHFNATISPENAPSKSFRRSNDLEGTNLTFKNLQLGKTRVPYLTNFSLQTRNKNYF